MALQTVAVLPFLIANGVATLMLARIIRGVATGVAASVLGAGLLDLDRVRGVMTNGLAPALGLALGALVSGVLVQYLPFPLRSAYLLLLAMTLLQGILALRLPETIARRVGALGSLRPTIRPCAGEVRVDPVVADQCRGLVDEWVLSFPRPDARPQCHGLAGTVDGSLAGVRAISAAAAVLAGRPWTARQSMMAGALCLMTGLGVTLLGANLQGIGIFFFGLGLVAATYWFGGALILLSMVAAVATVFCHPPYRSLDGHLG